MDETMDDSVALRSRRRGSGSGATDCFQEVLVALRQIIRATDMHSKRLTRYSGLTIPQAVALRAIRDMGEVTTRALSRRINLSQGTVTTILDRLEGRGLIERYRSTTDRRIVHARLTVSGREVLRRAPSLLDERFMGGFDALRRADQDRIVATLKQVAEMMGAGEIDAAPLLDIQPATAPPPPKRAPSKRQSGTLGG